MQGLCTGGRGRLEDMQGKPTQPESGLSHVVVAGGSPDEWAQMTVTEWTERIHSVARAAAAEGAHWVTVLPHHGPDFTREEFQEFSLLMGAVRGVRNVEVSHGVRFVWNSGDVHVIVDPSANGQQRFADTIEGLRRSGVSPDHVTEESVSLAVLAPADSEPDLVVILGPANLIPATMIWELAYSELVFLDLDWMKFETSHLELAIDDFNRRHRRFGGLDS